MNNNKNKLSSHPVQYMNSSNACRAIQIKRDVLLGGGAGGVAASEISSFGPKVVLGIAESISKNPVKHDRFS